MGLAVFCTVWLIIGAGVLVFDHNNFKQRGGTTDWFYWITAPLVIIFWPYVAMCWWVLRRYRRRENRRREKPATTPSK